MQRRCFFDSHKNKNANPLCPFCGAHCHWGIPAGASAAGTLYPCNFFSPHWQGFSWGKKPAVPPCGFMCCWGLWDCPYLPKAAAFPTSSSPPSLPHRLWLGAYVTGFLTEQNSSYKQLILANFAGLLVVYLCGMVYYAAISAFYLHNPIGYSPYSSYCFLLAVPGDIVLCVVAAILAKRLIPFSDTTGDDFMDILKH